MAANIEVLEVHINEIRDKIESMQEVLGSIQESLTQLVKLESDHQNTKQALTRAFNELTLERAKSELLNARISRLESELPALKESRKWFIAGLGVLVLGFLVNSSNLSTLVQNERKVSSATSLTKP